MGIELVHLDNSGPCFFLIGDLGEVINLSEPSFSHLQIGDYNKYLLGDGVNILGTQDISQCFLHS